MRHLKLGCHLLRLHSKATDFVVFEHALVHVSIVPSVAALPVALAIAHLASVVSAILVGLIDDGAVVAAVHLRRDQL